MSTLTNDPDGERICSRHHRARNNSNPVNWFFIPKMEGQGNIRYGFNQNIIQDHPFSTPQTFFCWLKHKLDNAIKLISMLVQYSSYCQSNCDMTIMSTCMPHSIYYR